MWSSSVWRLSCSNVELFFMEIVFTLNKGCLAWIYIFKTEKTTANISSWILYEKQWRIQDSPDEGGGGPKPIITARKRSFQSLSFHRCLSVHRGISVSVQGRGSLSRGGGLYPGGSLCRVPGVSVQWGSLCRGVSVWGGLCLGVSVQGVSIQGVSVQGWGLCLGRGVSVQGEVLSGRPPGQSPARTATSGRHASYWNPFLLGHVFLKTEWKWKGFERRGRGRLHTHPLNPPLRILVIYIYVCVCDIFVAQEEPCSVTVLDLV